MLHRLRRHRDERVFLGRVDGDELHVLVAILLLERLQRRAGTRWATGQLVFVKTSTKAFFAPKSSSVRGSERMSVNLSLPTRFADLHGVRGTGRGCGQQRHDDGDQSRPRHEVSSKSSVELNAILSPVTTRLHHFPAASVPASQSCSSKRQVHGKPRDTSSAASRNRGRTLFAPIGGALRTPARVRPRGRRHRRPPRASASESCVRASRRSNRPVAM